MDSLYKVISGLKAHNIDAALLCAYENVVYLSGFDTPVTAGAGNDLAGGYPLSYVWLNAKEASMALLTADFYKAVVDQTCFLSNTEYFTLYDHFSPIDNVAAIKDAVFHIVGTASDVILGIEKNSLPTLLYEHISQKCPNIRFKDITGVMNEARKVKTERELTLLRNAARVNDAGIKAFLQSSRNLRGENELEVWNGIVSAVTIANGEPMPVFGELITGQRAKPLGFLSGPIDRGVMPGEMGMVDLSVRCRGYWADCSNIAIFGAEPAQEQRRYARIVREAYDAAITAMRPGVRCSDVDAAARAVIERNGCKCMVYTGHQIGATVNELPRILSYDHSLLEKNMVFCIEPQVYTGEFGAVCYRMEKMVRVADDGVEELSRFDWGIE